MTMTIADMISSLEERDEVHMFEYTIIKHCEGGVDERIDFQNLGQLVDFAFDLDIQGWELTNIRKQYYPTTAGRRKLLSYGTVYVEFAQKGH